jgi:outer membrane protein assembly factor BamB
MKIVVCLMLCVSSALAAPIISTDMDTLHFGVVSAGGSHQRTLSVGNVGDMALIIDQVELTNSAFVLDWPILPDTVLAGQTRDYVIDFRPTEEMSYDSRAIFHSNDPATPADTIPVFADGVAAFAAGEIIWSYQAIANVVSVTPTTDFNNDGFPDLVAEAFNSGATGDNLTCLSGSGSGNGQLIWSARPEGGPSNSGGYGDQCLIAIDDLNHNGTQDIILGTAWGSRSIFGIEGSTGETIWSYDTYANPPSGWVYSVVSMGDLNGDSTPEVLAGLGSDANKGFCLNGADGQPLWSRTAGDVIYSVCRLDDVDGDGIADAILGAGDNDDRVYCLSGDPDDNGAIIWSYHTQGSTESVDRIADIDDDGINDVIVGIWYNGNQVIALSGQSDGNYLTHAIWSYPVGQPIMRVVTCPDLNGDGYEDVLVASWGSFALALSGVDGQELWRNYSTNDVWAIYWSYDVTDDGIPEVVSGCFDGAVTLINGATGETIWSTPTDAKIFTVRPIPDVNGDGVPDIIAGQQLLNGIGGKIYVISGGTVNQDAVDDDGVRIPEAALVLNSYPNPFNSETIISYDLAEPSNVRLEIYNIIGQRLLVLLDEPQQAGPHKMIWNGRDSSSKEVSSGVYFARITADDQQISHKLTLLR